MSLSFQTSTSLQFSNVLQIQRGRKSCRSLQFPRTGHMSMASHQKNPWLTFVTPNGFTRDASYAVKIAKEAIAGGVSLVQIRDQHATVSDKLTTAQILLDAGIPACKLALNGVHPSDILGLSTEVGVHIREAQIVEYLPIATKLLHLHAIIGCSVHSTQSALQATALGDYTYLQVGTMYATRSHPGKVPEGPALIKGIRRALGPSKALIGVGGINSTNLGKVFEMGADGIAVISTISASVHPYDSTRYLVEACRHNFNTANER